MDPHERFMKHHTEEGTYFLKKTASNSNMLSGLLEVFNTVVKDKYKYSNAVEVLETLRTVLCSFYQHKNKPKEYPQKVLKQLSLYPVNAIKVNEIQTILYGQLSADPASYSVQVPLVFDILSLHMTLFCDETTVWKYLEKLQDTIHSHLVKEKCLNPLDIKLMDCYMNSLLLHQRRSQFTANLGGVKVKASFLKNVQIWLTLKDQTDHKLLTLLLPKLIKLIPEGGILTSIWIMIFKLTNHPLSVLYQTANVWFPIQYYRNETLINQVMEEPFWLALLKGLSSPMPQERKEALTLIKRVVDFTDQHKSQGLELVAYREISPLICIGNESQQVMFKKNLTHFFLIIEALEEKQKDLVRPVYGLIKTLLNTPFDQENREAGLHIAWIRCVFMRILQLDDKDVVKWGLINGFTLDPELYNDDVLSVVIESLNNISLYENHTDQDEPTVVKKLINLLNNAETKHTDLVNRLVVKASKMTWGPVALYYVIHALSLVKRVASIWQEVELDAIKLLAESESNRHCQILCIGSQIELLEILTHFVTQSPDLVAIVNTLSAFSTNGALTRGQLSWKRISTWLAKIVKEEEALNFLEKVCKQLADESFEENLTMKSFSLIIMLFHDGHLVLNSKSCPGLTTLHNLLNCLIGADSRPYANAKLRTRSIELIDHLLGFTSSKDYILRELISNYIDATLQLTFKNLRKSCSEACNIDTHVSITQQIFTAESSIISKRDALNHLERFEVEAWNIIDDGEWSNNVQRLFGIKILYACVKANSERLKNYKYIGGLYNTYRTFKLQSPESAIDANKYSDQNRNSASNIAAEYHKLVADLFHEYLKDELVEESIPDINWLEQVLYLLGVGGKDILVSLIGILSQLFNKGVIRENDMDNFKLATTLCWKSILESNECHSALEEFIDLIFSSSFLECTETRKLTMEWTNEMLDRAVEIPEISMSLAKGLKQAKMEYLPDFYNLVLACLLVGPDLNSDKVIQLQACSYVLDCYQAVYPNYLSNMNANTNAVTRAHAVTLLHKMITDDPVHAAKLLPLIVAKLDESQKKEYPEVSQMHRSQNRIMQVLLVLQPTLEKDDIESLHLLICNMLTENSQPTVRIMQEWLLIRIYLESKTLRTQIWDLFDQGRKKCTGSLCSVMSVVYHVARLLPSDSQLKFTNLAFQYIAPYCMVQHFSVRSYAQVVVSKLYNLATDMGYSTLTEEYRGLYIPLTKGLKDGNLMRSSMKLQNEFCLKVFNPIDDYSLKIIFYDLPSLSNVSSSEYITPHLFEKFGFKESNSHPLKLLNQNSDMNGAQISQHVLKSSGSTESVAGDNDSSENCFDNIPTKCILSNETTPNEIGRIHKTLMPRQKGLMAKNNIILVASLIDELPNLDGLGRTCKILGAGEFVVSSIKRTNDEQFKGLSVSTEESISVKGVKPDQLQQYLAEKKKMGYRLVGVEQKVNGTNLMDVEFHQKTVLLLGNEETGIPVNLINLLDECIMIPKVSGVSSLDVGVTGAICMWEYFKQYQCS